MKTPALTKRLSKYKIKKCIIDLSEDSKKELYSLLKRRGYVEKAVGGELCFQNGFVQVFILDFFVLIKHDIGNSNQKGVRCFDSDTSTIKEFLNYFEKI